MDAILYYVTHGGRADSPQVIDWVNTLNCQLERGQEILMELVDELSTHWSLVVQDGREQLLMGGRLTGAFTGLPDVWLNKAAKRRRTQ